MENATDALKMMFAVFAFIVALSITLNSLTKTGYPSGTPLLMKRAATA